MNDLDIHLSAIAAGDATAFGRWASGCETRLRLSLTRYAARVDVEAVVQETLLRVWQVAPKFTPDGRPDSLARFAIRVARNVAISELRRLGQRPPPSDAIEPDAVPPCEPDPLLRRVIAACREKLPNKPMRALDQRLASGGGQPDKLLAVAVGMTLNTFLQNVTRARRLLAQCLEQQGVELWSVKS